MMTASRILSRRLPGMLVLLCLARPGAANELVVVVPTGSAVQSLTREQVINIFLGRFRQLPDGQSALPVDQPADEPLRAEFYQRLVNKTPADIRAYWARLVFSGKTAPPHPAASGEEVLEWLTERPGGIGYLRSDDLDARIRPVHTLGPLP